MRRLQQKLSKVYLRQQAKGGIIDLEEEGRRMLVVTRGEEETSSGTEFTELSPTDYQLGMQAFPKVLLQDSYFRRLCRNSVPSCSCQPAHFSEEAAGRWAMEGRMARACRSMTMTYIANAISSGVPGQVNFISCNCLKQAQQVKEEAVGGEGGIEAGKAKEVSPKENRTTG